MCAFIEGFSDISKSFLTKSIPDIQCGLRSIDLHSFNFEVDSYGAKSAWKLSFTIPHQQTNFAYSTITYDKIFQGDILLCLHYKFKLLLNSNTIKSSFA